jgi:hypothetical protein
MNLLSVRSRHNDLDTAQDTLGKPSKKLPLPAPGGQHLVALPLIEERRAIRLAGLHGCQEALPGVHFRFFLKQPSCELLNRPPSSSNIAAARLIYRAHHLTVYYHTAAAAPTGV